MGKSEQAAFEAVAADLPQETATLEGARRLVASVRDIDVELATLAERVAALSAKRAEIVTKTLVDLMQQAGITVLELAAEGNYSAFVAKLKPFVRANIAADWDADRREKAFAWLESDGVGDMIKRVISVSLGRDSEETAGRVRAVLHELGLAFDEAKAVPHATLTAWVKEQVLTKHRKLPLETLGATVGSVVEVSKPKEAKSGKAAAGK